MEADMSIFRNRTKKHGSNLKISESVVETVTKNATLEVEGVDSVAFGNIGLRGLVNNSGYSKPIKVEISEGVVHIQVCIIVDSSKRIPDLANAIQTRIKNSVQSMTGLIVSGVDVVIAGVTQSVSGVE